MAEILTGLSLYQRSFVIGAEGWGYISNGLDPIYAWDGLMTAAVAAGKTAPASTPTVGDLASAGSIAAGTHYARYRYNDKNTGYVSDASPQTSWVAAGGKRASVVLVASADARVDEIIVELTAADGATFYEASREANSSATANISISDTVLEQQILAYSEDGHEKPPVGRVMAYHKGRMFVGGPAMSETGVANCASAAVVTFVGADIKAAMDGYYILFAGEAKAYLIDAVNTVGATGQVTLSEVHSSLSSAAFQIFSPAKNNLYYSDSLMPDSFNLTDRYIKVLRGKSDILRGIIPYRSSLLVAGEHNLEMLSWESDPGSANDGRLNSIPGNRGVLAQECMIDVDGIVYAMDSLGVYIWNGSVPIQISGPVSETFKELDFTMASKFHAVRHPIKEWIMWFVCESGETEPKTALVYDWKRNEWGIHKFDRAITASCMMPDSNSVMRSFLGTEDGVTWFFDIGYSEGVFPTSTMKGTVVAGASTTVIEISEGGLYTTGLALAGVACYWVEGDQVRTIASNTATAVTVAAFATAPAVGDTLLFGRIVGKLTTKEFKIGAPRDDVLGTYLVLDFVELTSAKDLIVRVYENGSATAKADWVANTGVDGVTFQLNDAEILVDLSTTGGNVRIPLGASWKKSLTFEFEVKEPNVPLELLGYWIEHETAAVR